MDKALLLKVGEKIQDSALNTKLPIIDKWQFISFKAICQQGLEAEVPEWDC